MPPIYGGILIYRKPSAFFSSTDFGLLISNKKTPLFIKALHLAFFYQRLYSFLKM
jgi:hypothetical protein